MNQGELNQCSYQDYKTADRALNIIWPKVKAYVKSITANNKMNVPSEPDASKNLLKGQRAWLTYRDAQCETETAQYAGGSIQPLISNSCLAALTRKRTEELTLMMQTN